MAWNLLQNDVQPRLTKDTPANRHATNQVLPAYNSPHLFYSLIRTKASDTNFVVPDLYVTTNAKSNEPIRMELMTGRNICEFLCTIPAAVQPYES